MAASQTSEQADRPSAVKKDMQAISHKAKETFREAYNHARTSLHRLPWN
jgi:hypothetical protein